MKLHNTRTNSKETFKAKNNGKDVSIYLCGVTVYDYIHIGHARSSIVFDVLRRLLTYLGYNVTFIKNYTDIDDKIINRSNERNISWTELTSDMIKEHDRDMQDLLVNPPTYAPKATDYIKQMQEIIQKLIETNHAYVSKSNDVYFSTKSIPTYGELSNRKLEDMQVGARIATTEDKNEPFDFVLWKSSKPNEPKWSSPWGEGRPGWHSECCAIASTIAGNPIDIHCGGLDLIFPHHENELAQMRGIEPNKPFANYWLHNGFVNINNEKMSKSLNNFVKIRDILEVYNGEIIRFFILQTQYRKPIDYSDEALREASLVYNKFYHFLFETTRLVANKKGADFTEEINVASKAFEEEFIKGLEDDINTPIAVASIHNFINSINKIIVNKLSAEAINKIQEATSRMQKIVQDVMGLLNYSPTEWFDLNLKGISKDELLQKIEERTNAKKDKNFELADKIRMELLEKKVELLDTPQGTIYITNP